MVTKTPGGQAASAKFEKQEAAKQGLGAGNAPDPGKAPVASDSGSTKVGVEGGTNQPGEKGISGVPVDSKPTSGNANTK